MIRHTRHQLVLGTFGPPLLRIPVRLPVADLAQHVAILGAPNSGKSRLLAHLALSLIERGEGVTLLDPHADTARLVLSHLVQRGVFADPSAFGRIAYLDVPAAARVWRYTPFNILDQPFDTPTTSRLVLEAFKRAWPALDNGVAPAFENAVLAGLSVLRHHRLPVIFLHDLLTDTAWRSALVSAVPDAVVHDFFARLERWGAREQAQYLESTLRRAFLLSFSPVLRYSLGQRENRVGRFRERMDAGHSLIVNLALPDPDDRRLLGALLTVFMEQAALARADTPAGARGRPHTLILDEAPTLISQSGTAMQHIMEQCRKYGLGLVVAGQSERGFTEPVRRALGNVGTSIAFRLGREDAEAAGRRIGAIDPGQVKHAPASGGHPLYTPLAEQWEDWTATIQGLSPRRALVRRSDGRVAAIRTPDLPDTAVDVGALAAVEERYLADWFEMRLIIDEELKSIRPSPVVPVTARRRVIT